MLQLVSNIKTLLIEVRIIVKSYRRAKLVPKLKSSMGDIMTSLIPTIWSFLNPFRFDGISRSIVRLSNTGLPLSLTYSTDT